MDYPVERRITDSTLIRRERLLPLPGEVLVDPGALVEPDDIVARCSEAGELHVVDVCRVLSVGRERAGQSLRIAAGDVVEAGEVLAQPSGPLAATRGVCRAPVAGQVVSVQDGLILLEAGAEDIELASHLRGRVERILPRRGIVIAAAGALIQGVWGCGGEARGLLRLGVDHPQKPLLARSLDDGCLDALVAGGQGLSEYVLDHAVKAGVGGLIVGSVEPSMRPLLLSLPFPVLLAEGFGPLPMNRQAFSLLQAHDGREASMSVGFPDSPNPQRPELLIPDAEAGSIPEEEPGPFRLRVGTRVRCLRAPVQGQVGAVAGMPALSSVVDSGLRLRVAEVELEPRGRIVVVPRANLEIIR